MGSYQLRNSIDDEKLKDKIAPEDKEAIEKACKETITWLDDHQEEEKETYEEKKKELEALANPIMAKLYGQAGGAGGMPGGMKMPQPQTKMEVLAPRLGGRLTSHLEIKPMKIIY